MQVSNTSNENPYGLENLVTKHENISKNETPKEKSLEEEIKSSAVSVALSMNAQIILFAMNSTDTEQNNTSAQVQIIDFLSGKDMENGFNLKDIGYEGKPIIELSKNEAAELVAKDGFFGVEKTSHRVASFVLGFSGDSIELLKKGREGIVQGFEDAKQMWNGKLPDISYQTQELTLKLIDSKIETLENKL